MTGRPQRIVAPGTALVAAAVPALFVHVAHRPSVSVGGASLDVADALVLAVACLAAFELARRRTRPTQLELALAASALAFLAWMVVDTFLPGLRGATYDTRTHLITGGKYAEYALLAFAVPVLLRRTRDVRVVLGVVVAWGVIASSYGAFQLVTGAGIGPAGRRKPSFLGFHDFAALSGAVLVVGLVAIALGRRRRTTDAATAAGALGVVVSGAISAVLGLFGAAAAILVVAARRGALDRRRAAAVGAIVLVTAVGTASLRGPQVEHVLRFLHLAPEQRATGGIESYAHRSVLAYIGLRIFLDRPVAGAGWQASTSEEATYERYLPAARRRFPQEPAYAFPAREHPWGVQNAYIQTLADLGLVGFVLLSTLLALAVSIGLHGALAASAEWASFALVGAGWILVAMGVFVGIGLVAGIPLDAAFWLGCGLAATGGRARA